MSSRSSINEAHPLITGSPAYKKLNNVPLESETQIDIDPIEENTCLKWENVNTFVNLPKPSIITKIRYPNKEFPKEKQVLFNVSGKVESGMMLAIMGASGSGKTTLLNALAGFLPDKIRCLGEVYVNDKPVDMPSISAYVHQSDLFITTLTVEEHLYFTASLLFDKIRVNQQIIDRVNELLKQFGLEDCKNTLIGSPVGQRGISGGELRRLTIASQVIRRKNIIFLDEPTSGLDSFSAENVISIIKKMAEQKCVIICTIHQPSSLLFSSFDQLILLSEGKCVFNGARNYAIEFFSKAGFNCPEHYNPADFFIEKLAIKAGKETSCHESVEKLIEERKKDPLSNIGDSQTNIEQIKAKKAEKHSCKTRLSAQFCHLIKRAWVTNYREPQLLKARLIQTVLMGIIYGLIYFRLESSVENVPNFVGGIFGSLAQITFGGVLGVLFVFPAEMNVFMREHRSKLYGTSMYFLAKSLAELPIFVLSPILYSSIIYYMAGFNPAFKGYLIFTGTLILVSICSVGFGYVISAFAKNYAMASSLSTPLLIPFMVFGGFFIRSVNIPVYFRWISYISWFKYGFEVLIISQFTGLNLNCSNSTNSGCLPGVKSIPGENVIAGIGLSGDNIYLDIGCLFALIVGFRIVAWLALMIRTYINER